jgi:hypothetical protein
VKEILEAGENRPPMLLLNGRLQWLTLASEWRFLPEPLDEQDGLRLGVAKDVGQTSPSTYSLCGAIQSSGRSFAWAPYSQIPARISPNGYEVFYDDEGRYLRHRGDHGEYQDSVLLVSARVGRWKEES